MTQYQRDCLEEIVTQFARVTPDMRTETLLVLRLDLFDQLVRTDGALRRLMDRECRSQQELKVISA